ncbi:Rab3 GTPase-activating protein regulatory subunit N-terminus-domain-containing protein [Pavlovales sp. CCMP2436]|nr:Rab3 GTPase-activating protein regulatory subunit N-terminus-domain-containing protein [Pavlovales sp. CCMP2436]
MLRLSCTSVGALPSAPHRGRCSALPGGELVAIAVSPTEVACWSPGAGGVAACASVHTVCGDGQAAAGAPPPSRVCDVVCFRVPALASRGAFACMCVGFETGELRIFRADAAGRLTFLFATRAHGSELRRLRVRGACELCVLHEAALVLVDGDSLRGVLHSCARAAADATSYSPWGPASTMPAVESLRWALPALGGVHALGLVMDAVCCGRPPAGPFEAEATMADARCFVLAGSGAQACLQTVLAADEDAGGSAADLAFEAATAVFSVVSSVTRGLFWGGRTSAELEPQPPDAQLAQPPPVSLNPVRSLADPPRGARTLSVHPAGGWAAIADSLGRVLLVELPSLIVRRMWRGYRDAQCAWLVAPHADGDGASVHLALYAPLRGLLELWTLPCGPRAAVLSVGSGGFLAGGCSTHTPLGDASDVCAFISAEGQLHRVAAGAGGAGELGGLASRDAPASRASE